MRTREWLVHALVCLSCTKAESGHSIAEHVVVDATTDDANAAMDDTTCVTTGSDSCRSPLAEEEEGSEDEDSECGIYLAQSTIPGAGLGMYANRHFDKDEELMAGDVTIPILDIVMHYGRHFRFLYDEYTWNAGAVNMEHLSRKENNVASPGFGSAANSFLDLVNVEEGVPVERIDGDMHRSKDPGAGAFNTYHSRMATAATMIEPGHELFVSYGSSWFLGRVHKIGVIPVKGDLPKAENLSRKFLAAKSQLQHVSNDAMQEFWETFVTNTSQWKSRVLVATPPWDDLQEVNRHGIIQHRRKTASRSKEWLQEHGTCADHLVQGTSRLPQAGQGAFAARNIKAGDTVIMSPLIHIPFVEVFDMYPVAEDEDGEYYADHDADVVGKQLLLNYCLGHPESTMVFSPYGPVFNLINHNQTLKNTRLRWSSPERSNQNMTLLEQDFDYMETLYSAQLAIELVATRDIKKGEEIYYDYGDEWEAAWQSHIANWKAVEGASSYVSAEQLNKDKETTLKTEFEALRDPYPENIRLKYISLFDNTAKWRQALDEGRLEEYIAENDFRWIDCEILRYRIDENNRILYTAAKRSKNGTLQKKLIEDVPREAFFFLDEPYTTDMFLPNAFRHHIGIPDEIFPEKWRNLKKTS